jgi:hypothetical protein
MTCCTRKSKSRFTKEEDMKIIKSVETMKATIFEIKWKKIASQLKSRTSKQVREHYLNFLSPNVNKNPLTTSELNLLIQIVANYSKSSKIPWKKISAFFPGRTDIFLKNKYDHVKRKILKNVVKPRSDEILQYDLEQLLWNGTFTDQMSSCLAAIE